MHRNTSSPVALAVRLSLAAAALALCTIALGALQTILTFTGYMSLQAGRVVTKENFREEIKLALAKR